jgi:hypothetical protein
VEEVLRLTNGLERATVGSATVITADRRTHLSLSPEEVEILDALEGRITQSQMTDRFGSLAGDLVTDLREAGLLAGSEPPQSPKFTLSSTGLEFDGFDRLVARVHRLLPSWICSRVALVLALGLMVVGLGAVLSSPPPSQASFPATVTLAFLLAICWVESLVHETAHALVIDHHGRRVGRAGFGFYWGEAAFVREDRVLRSISTFCHPVRNPGSKHPA